MAHVTLCLAWLLVCCSQVRPRGKWGYYGYPVGYTKASGQMPDRAQNDELGWLLNASSGWFPTVYLNGRPGKFGTRCSAPFALRVPNLTVRRAAARRRCSAWSPSPSASSCGAGQLGCSDRTRATLRSPAPKPPASATP